MKRSSVTPALLTFLFAALLIEAPTAWAQKISVVAIKIADLSESSQATARLAGELVAIEILRDGKDSKVLVTSAERPEAFANSPSSVDPRENLVSRVGILGLSLNPQIAKAIPLIRVSSGVVVASTVEGMVDGKEGGLLYLTLPLIREACHVHNS